MDATVISSTINHTSVMKMENMIDFLSFTDVHRFLTPFCACCICVRVCAFCAHVRACMFVLVCVGVCMCICGSTQCFVHRAVSGELDR